MTLEDKKILCIWIGRINIVNNPTKKNYEFHAIPIKTPYYSSQKYKRVTIKFTWKHKDSYIQGNVEQKE